MKIRLIYLISTILFPLFLFGQSFTFHADTVLNGNPGDLIQFHGSITNNTQGNLSIRVIRTLSQLPANWSSSLCVGLACFPPDQDTVTVPGDIPNPLSPGETTDFFLDVFTDPVTPGAGSVSVAVENMNNPAESIELTFHASTNPTGIVEKEQPVTGTFQLLPNYPNPFNPETHIPFEIGRFKSVQTNLSVYNILGQRVRVIVNQTLAPGVYEANWDGRDNTGNPVSSGLYFYQLSAGNTNLLGRMILMK